MVAFLRKLMTSSPLKEIKLHLIKYRDAGLPTYTYFWVMDLKVISPYFDTENEAMEWMKGKFL